MEKIARLGTSVSVVTATFTLFLYARFFAYEEALLAEALPGQRLYSDNLGFPIEYLVVALGVLCAGAVLVLLWQVYLMSVHSGRPIPNPWMSRAARVIYVIMAIVLVAGMVL